MSALRIRDALAASIPGLPELEPMIGKSVEIIVLGDDLGPEYSFRVTPSVEDLHASQGVSAVTVLAPLIGGWPGRAGDAWIAAACLRHKPPLVTHNQRHFAGIPGLQVLSGG